jgi:hypothetical protein
VGKVWRQLRRVGLAEVFRGKPVKTTVSNPAVPCPRDKVNRQFQASRPDAVWVSDFTYVATWQGFVYVVFVIDVFAADSALSDGGFPGLPRPPLCSMPWSKHSTSAALCGGTI